jgi:hypothetical protein
MHIFLSLLPLNNHTNMQLTINQMPRRSELPAEMRGMDRYSHGSSTTTCFTEKVEDFLSIQRHVLEGKYAHMRELPSPEKFDEMIDSGLARAAKNEIESKEAEKKIAQFKECSKRSLDAIKQVYRSLYLITHKH